MDTVTSRPLPLSDAEMISRLEAVRRARGEMVVPPEKIHPWYAQGDSHRKGAFEALDKVSGLAEQIELAVAKDDAAAANLLAWYEEMTTKHRNEVFRRPVLFQRYLDPWLPYAEAKKTQNIKDLAASEWFDEYYKKAPASMGNPYLYVAITGRRRPRRVRHWDEDLGF